MNTFLRAAKPKREQVHVTENYESVPPSMTITDADGSVWTLATQFAPRGKCPRGEYAFGVVFFRRDGTLVRTGEAASRIERRGNRIKIFTAEGWKRWTGAAFV